MKRLLLVSAFVAGVAVLSGGAGPRPTFAQCPEAHPYVLLPPSWTCPVIPMCTTQYGFCRWPHYVARGAQCQCRAANGAWIPGLITRGTPGTE